MMDHLTFTRLRFSPLLLLPFLIVSCNEPDENLQSTYISDEVAFDEGTAEVWVEVDGNNNPFGIGVILSEDFSLSRPDDTLAVDLPWPDEVDPVEPYQMLRLYFLPDGHSPAGFNVSHIKLRTYLVDEQEFGDLADAGPEVREATPDSAYIPSGFEKIDRDDNPPIGSQWTNPEQTLTEFNYSYAYGFNEGELVFLETMIASDALDGQPDNRLQIPQPQAFQRSGYYPQINYVAVSGNTGRNYIGIEELNYHSAE